MHDDNDDYDDNDENDDNDDNKDNDDNDMLKVMHEMTACYNVSVSCTGQGMVAQVSYFDDDIVIL